jgi:hypothetical protein
MASTQERNTFESTLDTGLEEEPASQMQSEFDPEEHISFKKPCSVLTMENLGLADDLGISPVAVTHPFPLFSPEAVRIMQTEIAKSEVKRDHHFTSNIATSQLRGYARKHAPFTYAA